MIIIFIIGVLIGSFLAVLAKRIPLKENITTSRSQCDSCKKTLQAVDLIPFFNLLFHQNKCRYCKEPIHFYHSAFEIMTGCLFLIYYLHFSVNIKTLYILILWLMAITLSLTDYLYYLVEPKLLYTFYFLALAVYTITTHHFNFRLLIAPIFFLLFFLVISYIFQNSIGGGDIKLLIAWSFFLGIREMLWLILVASFLGIIFIFLTQLFTSKKIRKIPFVPFLSIALLLVTLYFH